MLHLLRRIRSNSLPFILGASLLKRKHFDIDENFEVDTDPIPLVLPNQRAWPNVTKDKYRAGMNQVRKKVQDKLFKFQKDHYGSEGMAIACASGVNESIPHVINVGYSDLENKVLVHDRTKLRIGTLSMPLTALVACHLVSMGFIELDGRDFTEEAEDRGYNLHQADLSLRSMIRNSHGFHDLTESQVSERGALTWKRISDLLQATFVHLCSGQADGTTTWVADPTRCYQFSRYTYVVIGRMLKQIKQNETGKIMEEFFLNNGMADTVIDYKQRLILFRSKHYKKSKSTDKNKKAMEMVNYIDPSLYPTVHGCMSTAYDIARLGQKILSNRHDRYVRESLKFANPHIEHIGFLTENFEISADNVHRCVLGDIEKIEGEIRFTWLSHCVGSASILYMSGEDHSESDAAGPSRRNIKPRISVAILTNCEFSEKDDEYKQHLKVLAREVAQIYNQAFQEITQSSE